MFAKSMLLIPVLFLALVQPSSDEKAKKHLELIQGVWTMDRLEINGKEISAEQIGETLLNVKKDQYNTTVKAKELFGFRIKLDTTKDPHWIDMIQKQADGSEKLYKGIYKIENGKFWMCRGGMPEQERPNQFATWPDTGYFVVTWKRIK